MSHHKVIILGSGPAGLTAAIYTARAGLSPLLIHGPAIHGQLAATTEVENFPGFSKGIQGPDLMLEMEAQAKRFGCTFVTSVVENIDTSTKPLKLKTSSETYTADTVIFATGATAKTLGIPGERELWGYGVSTCATCDGAFFKNQVITVTGGGDSACEEALFLTRFASKVYLVHRRDELRASKIMAERVKNHEKIEIIWNTKITGVVGDKTSGLSEIKLENTVTGETSSHKTGALFVAIGHVPNSVLLKGKVEMDENDYIITKSRSTATDVQGLFVCGDVQDHVFRQAITAAGTGCMAAIEAERYLSEV